MSASTSTSYIWSAAGWVRTDEAPSGPLLVADSWRSSDGRVAAFEAHRQRFERSVASVIATEPGAAITSDTSLPDPVLGDRRATDSTTVVAESSQPPTLTVGWEAFWGGVTTIIQRAHRSSGNPELFPRVSLRSQAHNAHISGSDVPETSLVPTLSGEAAAPSSSQRHEATGPSFQAPDSYSPSSRHPELVLDVRPAPAIRRATRLLYAPIPDPRHNPRIKGPDLARLSAAREQAVARGFDDLLICANDGSVLETCTGNLMWWDGDAAVFPERQTQLLPGVTAEQVRLRLEEIGVPLRFADVSVAELAGRAVWFLNSLHGISPVSVLSDRGKDVPLAHHPHEDEWREWWNHRHLAAPTS
ncbi:MAG: aminotransferase class IV [Ancrocorticia sp.]